MISKKFIFTEVAFIQLPQVRVEWSIMHVVRNMVMKYVRVEMALLVSGPLNGGLECRFALDHVTLNSALWFQHLIPRR